MKVCYVQSGGFIGALKSCEVNTAELGQEEAEQLEKLVRDWAEPVRQLSFRAGTRPQTV